MAKLFAGQVWTTDVNQGHLLSRWPRFLTMNHSRWLSLSCQWIPSWDAVANLARISKFLTSLCRTGIGDLTQSFWYHMLGVRCHLGSNPPYW